MGKDNSMNNNLNYYKITTHILLIILFLCGLFYLFNYYGDLKYKQGILDGSSNTINKTVRIVNSQGYVKFRKDNQNVTLVKLEEIKNAQDRVINNILDLVKSNGYVALKDKNNKTVVLINKISFTGSNLTLIN